MTIQDIMPRRLQARELLGDYWLNGRPLSLADLRGQVVLLDFWDFTSSASLRTLPYVLAWAEMYRPLGFTVIGVHVPRFAFGQEPERIAHTLRRLGIGYPVVMDNSQLIWTQYSNRVWPTKHLVDVDGFIRCQSIGEGGYGPFERSLQHLLHEAHPLEDLPDLMEPLRETDRPGCRLLPCHARKSSQDISAEASAMWRGASPNPSLPTPIPASISTAGYTFRAHGEMNGSAFAGRVRTEKRGRCLSGITAAR